MAAKPETIDAYLITVSADQRAALEKLRKAILAILPDAEECIRDSAPAFRYAGHVVAGFVATSKGCSYFPFSETTLATMAADVEAYDHTKSALHFDPTRPLPVALVRQLLEARIAEIRVVLGNYPRSILQKIVGDAFVVEAEVDFERDILDRLDRARLVEAISSLRVAAALERRCCLRLETSNPSPAEWLLLARSMNADIAERACEHLLAHEPSVDALELVVLGGSLAHKDRAAEIILAQPPHAGLLRCVLSTFVEGPIAERAWRALDTLHPDIDLLTHVIKWTKQPSVARAAWERVAAQSPSAAAVSHLLVFSTDPWVREQAADHLLRGGLDELDELSHVLDKSPNPEHRDEAARRILGKRKPKPGGDHLAAVVLGATDRALIDRAWTAFAALSFTASKRDQWNLVKLRNIVCSAGATEIRARAFEHAKNAPFDADHRAYIAKHAQDAEVREAFAKER